MSDTSIPPKDQGYTPPDFLANLFKKPLYSPISLTSLETSSSMQEKILSPSSKQNITTSLTVIDAGESNDSKYDSKLFRTFSMAEEDKIHNKKYKLFFKTIMQGSMSDEQMNGVWNKLQNSLSNPYEFDLLLEETKLRKDKQLQAKQNKQQQQQKVNIDSRKSKVRSKSNQKQHSRQAVEFRSVKKDKIQSYSSKSMKKSIIEEVKQIKTILLNSTRQIHNRK